VATPIITDGTMERVVSAPRVVLPDTVGLFAERASRFLQLANDHPMADYLKLMAAVSQAQHDVLGVREAPAVPDEALERSRDYGMPPLTALSHARDPQWRDDLHDLLAQVEGHGVPAQAMVKAVRCARRHLARGAGRPPARRRHAG
jgi:FdhE protein